MGFVSVRLGQSWSELVRFGWAGLVSRELVSHGTVGLVLFWFGRCVEAMYVELHSVVVRHGRRGKLGFVQFRWGAACCGR